jgi:steroid delta-isomerase-like uncharacterized protein
MSAEENKDLVRRCIEAVNERDSSAAGQTYAEGYIYHGPGGQEIRGREGLMGMWAVFLDAFPDLKATIDDIVAEGDKVTLRWTIRGTHTGEFQGIAPTNNQITMPIIEIFRIEGGFLAEAWDMYDQLSFMQQIGAVPE